MPAPAPAPMPAPAPAPMPAPAPAPMPAPAPAPMPAPAPAPEVPGGEISEVHATSAADIAPRPTKNRFSIMATTSRRTETRSLHVSDHLENETTHFSSPVFAKINGTR